MSFDDDERVRAEMVRVAEATLPPAQLRSYVHVVVCGEQQKEVAARYGVAPSSIAKSLHGTRRVRGGIGAALTPSKGGGALARMSDALASDSVFVALLEELKAPTKQAPRHVIDCVGWFRTTSANEFVGRAVELVVVSLVDARGVVSIDSLREELDMTVLGEGLRQLRLRGVVDVHGQTVTYSPSSKEIP